MDEVLTKMKHAVLKRKTFKCETPMDLNKNLGRLVDKHVVKPDPEAHEKPDPEAHETKTWKAPMNGSELLRSLDFANY